MFYYLRILKNMPEIRANVLCLNLGPVVLYICTFLVRVLGGGRWPLKEMKNHQSNVSSYFWIKNISLWKYIYWHVIVSCFYINWKRSPNTGTENPFVLSSGTNGENTGRASLSPQFCLLCEEGFLRLSRGFHSLTALPETRYSPSLAYPQRMEPRAVMDLCRVIPQRRDKCRTWTQLVLHSGAFVPNPWANCFHTWRGSDLDPQV